MAKRKDNPDRIGCLVDFVREHADASLEGFYWRPSERDYRCVVLAVVETPRHVGAAEFRGEDAAKLAAAARAAGFNLGKVAEVRRLCESAGCSWQPPRGRIA